jgi:hypothetical protein
MKKITLLVAALVMLITYVNAQSQRLVLFEEFTQASCPPCASTNPALNTMLNANQSKVVSVKYQTSWPGVDPMNAQNPSEVATRVTYYGVTGVPDGELDGGQGFSGQPASMTAAMVNTRYNVTSPFTIDVTHNLTHNPDVIHAHAVITATGAVTGTTLVAQMAVIERRVYFSSPPGTNGEKEFEGVMKKMLPNASGTTLPNTWSVGASQTIDLDWTLSNVYDTNQLAVVVWVQDNSNQHVIQAGYSQPHIPNDAGVTAVTGFSALTCNTTTTPTATITNYASAALTSCTITYSVDNGAPVDYIWSGNLAQGATTTQALTPITVASGSHTVEFYTTMPNGAADLDSHNDGISKVFAVYGNAGAMLPLVYAFAPSTFPPTDWYLSNPDEGYTWTRSASGYLGAGSAKCDFYNSSSGNIDYLGTNNFDFSTSGVTSAQIDFDISYCQYSTENDRLQVEYSLNCGATWTSIYNEAGATLASGNPAYNTGAWTPTASSWHHKTAQLTGAIGNASVFIRFKATSAWGNNLYVDNINVSTNLTTSVPTIVNDKSISIYPNPSQGEVNLSLQLDKAQDVMVTVTNTLGAVVNTLSLKDVSSGVYPLDLKNQAKGNYIVIVKTNDDIVTKRISITE